MEDQRTTGNEQTKEKSTHRILLLFSVVLFLIAVSMYVSVFLKPAKLTVMEENYDPNISSAGTLTPVLTSPAATEGGNRITPDTSSEISAVIVTPSVPAPSRETPEAVLHQPSPAPTAFHANGNPAAVPTSSPAGKKQSSARNESPAPPPSVVVSPSYPVRTPSAAHTEKLEVININTASVDDLDKLPYVGKKKAQKIIEYREKNGKFTCPEDIMNVNGIGKGIFESIKDRIKTE
ncbi:MAG: helix-hairpin-helix domain-containing protein [Firmicutes bacterium]|nr:helix-hairpin-helix domain-containing protein [Bacillota bacterium]